MTHRFPLRQALIGVLGLALAGPAAHAASVGGSYMGIIDEDSGLGLIGQTMRVDFSYDDAVVGFSSSTSTSYSDFIEALTVTIGTNVWNWQSSGGSFAILNNDAVISFAIGTEDRVFAEAYTFVGPDLVASPVAPEAYAFSLYPP